MKLWAWIVVQVLAAGACTAAPVTLRCITDDGERTGDAIVDIDRRVMTFGIVQYEIRSITDRYITAIHEPSDKVGGELWVLDRASGEYQRASVGFVTRGVNGAYTPFTLEAHTYRGTCTKPLL